MSVYTGIPMGFAQENYFDQQATALEGSLAFVSDINLIDAAVVDMPDGGMLNVGRVVMEKYSAGGSRPGMTSTLVSLPDANVDGSESFGITIRNQSCETDSDGNNGWRNGRVCNVLRLRRVGGRIWVKAQNSTVAGTPASFVIADTTNHGFPIGSLVGSGLDTDTLEMPNAIWRTTTSAGQLALLEILQGSVIPPAVVPLDEGGSGTT